MIPLAIALTRMVRWNYSIHSLYSRERPPTIGLDSPSKACGEDSDCINRLTLVECIEGECRCKSYCQNQRWGAGHARRRYSTQVCPCLSFQRHEYANVDVIKTEKKGFGLQARGGIAKWAMLLKLECRSETLQGCASLRVYWGSGFWGSLTEAYEDLRKWRHQTFLLHDATKGCGKTSIHCTNNDA